MPKEKPHARHSARAPSVASLRAKIDRLDRSLVQLMNERARLALKIGKLKDNAGETIYSPAREEDVLNRVMEQSRGPLAPDCIRSIYRELISGSRSLEKQLRVAYLGPAYSYTHLAALERFGGCVELVPVSSIAAVFEEVNRGHASYGLVPVENSTDGRIADTLEMFTRLPVRICGEVQLWIHHNLLGRCPRSEVTEVYSRPQALSQCRNWLSKNVPHASLHEVASTATAAELAQREPGAAAVASRQAAVRYGLRILFSDIEDSPYNETRFAVIGMQETPRTGRDKTSVMFQVSNQSGALVEALTVFKQAKINLTWIESFPARQQGKQEYVFFVEFEGHAEDPKVKRALNTLAEHCKQLSVLGSYPMASTAE
jgi:chorismate mutase/prephenate dehydratase